MKRCFVFLILFLTIQFGSLSPLLAQGQIDLEQIVVTPYAGVEETTISETPYATKVYTEKHIKASGSSTVIDFLRNVPSLHVSDYYGTNVKTTVDMMGFGDNAASNMLVLVNGRKINEIDMSGVNWTELPLKNVERIEVIRGGGVVLYGEGAAGGIVNIISKDPQAKDLSVEVNFEAGSYRSTKESISASGGEDLLSFRTFSEYHSTSGYRQNSHYRSKYSSIELNSRPTEQLEISADLTHHEYIYGLPDDITEAERLAGTSRRDSTTPLNNYQREDNTLGLTIKNEFSPELIASVDLFYRNRNELEDLLSYSMSTDKHITNFQARPQLLLSFDTRGIQQELIAGFEFYSSDLSADTSSAATDIDRQSLAWFLQDEISFNEKLAGHLGARVQKEKFTFDYFGSTSTDDGLNFREGLYETGLNYKIDNESNIYLNFSRGLRVGKTDEYLVTWPAAAINTNLKPQRSKTISLGANMRLTDFLTTSLDYFQMNVNNEIYYNPGTFANENYSKIRRQGANLTTTLTPFDNTKFTLGYRFIDAKFRGGVYAGKEVPFVPKAMLTASVKYDFFERFSFFADYLYRDKVYLINDLNNISPKLKSYNTTNIKLSYTGKKLELFAGVNNLFNELYSEYAATNLTGTTRGLYPSPERNFFAGCKVSF
ncbi:MAG: TonB-dependent receptor [Candidatus Omnitrophica bacterium]|nr:TonB-dependent receptor [Candidatus Omnitrophota bacterium]